MHSRVFDIREIPDDKEKYEDLFLEVDYNYEDSIYESMKSIADYVDKRLLDDEIEWIKVGIESSNLGTLEKIKDCYKFTPDKEKIKDYFGEKLVSLSNYIAHMSTEEFIEDEWTLKTTIDDEFGIRVWDSCWSYSWDRFLRDIVRSDAKEYLIINSYDYHF